MQKNSNLRKLVFIALLTAQGIILGLLEQAIPFPFTFAPGAKLGLANIVTLISLYTLSFKEVVLVVVMKTLMTTVLGGRSQPSSTVEWARLSALSGCIW